MSLVSAVVELVSPLKLVIEPSGGPFQLCVNIAIEGLDSNFCLFYQFLLLQGVGLCEVSLINSNNRTLLKLHNINNIREISVNLAPSLDALRLLGVSESCELEFACVKHVIEALLGVSEHLLELLVMFISLEHSIWN